MACGAEAGGPALDAHSAAGRIVVFAWLAGAIVAALRLTGGVWSAARLRRRSRPVLNACVNDLLDSLAAQLDLARAPELRVADLPGLPATAGWRRPIVLLPADWPRWSAAELRAALAHELAHVRSGDFLTLVLAAFFAVPHFYHPLVRRLVARLRLRREQAADALAGRLAGGPHEYLRALAGLALRRDPAGAGVPPPLLLSAHGGDLFRRIQMLRNMEMTRPLPRVARAAALAALAASALLASALRGPAVPPAPKPAPAGQEAEPFDLSYLGAGEDSHAVLGVRPAVLLAQPGMDVYAKAMRDQLGVALKSMGRTMPEGLSVADVDQIVADVDIKVQGEGGKGKCALMCGSRHLMIRMKCDVDWPKVIAALLGEDKTVKQDGHTIHVVKSPILGPGELGLWQIDARTLLMVQKKDDTFVIPVKRAKPAFNLGPAWKQVEHCAFAIGYDNRGGQWAKEFAPETTDLGPAFRMIGQTESICLGLRFADGIEGQVYLVNPGEAQARSCTEAIHALVKMASDRMAESRKSDETSASDLVAMKLFEEMFKTGRVEQVGRK